MTARLLAALALVAALAGPAAADPAPEPKPAVNLKITTGATIITDAAKVRRVPPGRYLSEDLWQKLDGEVRRLQDAETRLAAENQSLRDSAKDGPGWGWLVGFGVGVAAGIGAAVWAY